MKNFLFLMLILLNACGSATEGFKLKKGNNADEFLVEKKNPLVLPPNFNELPSPDGNKISNEYNDTENFKSTLIKKNEVKQEMKKSNNPSTTEEFILKNIKKNESN